MSLAEGFEVDTESKTESVKGLSEIVLPSADCNNTVSRYLKNTTPQEPHYEVTTPTFHSKVANEFNNDICVEYNLCH